MSTEPVITITSAFGDVFAEGTIQFKGENVIGWRAVQMTPNTAMGVGIWWKQTGTPIASPTRLINVRKRILPMLTKAYAPSEETTNA